MRVDIRLPIGLLFSALGLLLGTYGALGDVSIYGRSLGINVNLAWGSVLVIFGVVMVILSYRGRRTGRAVPRSGMAG